MPEPCSVCWREVPALPEQFERYLLEVGEKIRWKRARPFVMRELRTHLEEQKEAFLAAGMNEKGAEEAALRDMGQAAEVGEGLDAVHRPRQQWGLAVWVLLLSFGGCLLRIILTAGAEYEAVDPMRAAAAVVLGTVLLFGMYHLDYTILARRGKAIYAAAVAAGILSLVLSPQINGAFYYTRYVVLCYPVVYAIWIGTLRGRGWKGIVLALLGGVPLAEIACIAPYTTGLLLLLLSGFAALLACGKMDWFGVGRNQTLAAVFGSGAGLSLPVLWFLCSSTAVHQRLVIMLHPERDALGRGYMGMAVRKALSQAAWLGEGRLERSNGLSLEWLLPEWDHDCFLVTIVLKLGWIPCLVMVGAAVVLFAILLGRSMTVHNRFGRILALSAVLPLVAQGVGAVGLNLGFILTSLSFPLFSGNLHTVLTMGMMGLLLSVFRQQALPEWQLNKEDGDVKRENSTYFA